MYVRWIRDLLLALFLTWRFISPTMAEDSLVTYSEALEAYRAQRWETAESRLVEWLTEHGEHAQAATALLLKAETRVQQRKYRDARQTFLRFLRRHPEHSEIRRALFRAGECAYFSRDFEPARRELADFWERYPQDELNAHVLYYLGDLALLAEDAETATRWYERSLERFPQGPLADDARLGLARSWEALGKIEEARQAYRALIDEDSRLVSQARRQLGRLERSQEVCWQTVFDSAEAAYEAEDYAGAAAQFARLTQEDVPAEWGAEGWSGLGWTRYQQEDFAGAVEAFHRLQEAFPAHGLASEAGLVRARAFERAGRQAEALEAFLQVARSGPPDQAGIAWFQAAGLQEQLGDPAAALQSLEQLLEQAPNFEDLDAALYQKAWLLTESQRSVAAETVWQRLHDEHASSRFWADATYRLAERALRAERLEQAGQWLAQLQDRDSLPDDIRSHTWYLQAQWAAAEERWEDVPEPLERLRAEFPDSPLRLPAEYWIAEARYQQQEYEQAAAALERLSQEITDDSESWLAMVPLRSAQILAEQERWEAAEEVAGTIAARFPGFRQQYQADLVIGRCRAARGQYPQAREAFEQVVRSPEGGASQAAAEAQWRIGKSYQQQGDYAAALRAFELVERLFPYPKWQAAALLHRGQCHQRRGEPDEARRVYQRLLQEHPQTVPAREAQAQVSRPGASSEIRISVQESNRD